MTEEIKNRDSYGTRLAPVDGGASVIMAINDRAMLEHYYVYSKTKHPAVMARILAPKMDEEWKRHLRNDTSGAYDWFEKPLKDQKLSALREKLVAFAGDAVCLAFDEPDIDVILERGQFWPGHNAKLIKGYPSKCHRNAADLYRINPELVSAGKLCICTGYALSEDGLWRQHSWLIRKNQRSNQIIETTQKRVLYMGAVLTAEESKKFCQNVCW